jgi:chromosome segregation ATPase
MAFMDWPWSAAIQQMRTALAAVRAKDKHQDERLTHLEHAIMTQQASLEALTTKVNMLTGIAGTIQADIGSAVTALQELKAQIAALVSGATAIDDTVALDQLTASVDGIILGLSGSATAIEAAVSDAKA